MVLLATRANHDFTAFDYEAVGQNERISLPETAVVEYTVGCEMKYTKQYENQEWLYTVWGSESPTSYILLAVHPGVGWQDIAIHLTDSEVEMLRRSEEEFTQFVKAITARRDDAQIKTRRIESQILRYDADELEL
jgi:hypothetical protein